MKLKLALVAVGLVTAALMLTSYKHDVKFEMYIGELTATTNELAAEGSRDLSSVGVARAQKILDAKKPDLKKKLAELKTVPASQVDAKTLERFQESIRANRAKIKDVFLDNPAVKEADGKDPEFLGNVVKLVEDYVSLIE
jgi:hypothetical protein